MTTEIAILNKTAVALAADSAMTVSSIGPTGIAKVLNSANKLFTLSKCAPVGIMIYNNAELMGIPWETIIKMYRHQLGEKVFDSVEEYCDDFFKFIPQFPILKEMQPNYITFVARSMADFFVKEIDAWGKKRNKREALDNEEIRGFLAVSIARISEDEIAQRSDAIFTMEERKKIGERYREIIERETGNVSAFLAKKEMELLHDIIVDAALRVAFNDHSGIVVAGFGQSEVFPSLINCKVSAVIDRRTIRTQFEKEAVSVDIPASINPFAQANDIKNFMEGIGSEMEEFLLDTCNIIVKNDLPAELYSAIESKIALNETDKKELQSILQSVCAGCGDAVNRQFQTTKSESYWRPIVRATALMTKTELASMSETLVHLVSFRQQVTMDTETVGGPIDVAVITKGDGFIWMKRKHYFSSELNHHFFENYFRRKEHNGQNRELQPLPADSSSQE